MIMPANVDMKLKDILATEGAKEVLDKDAPGLTIHPQIKMAMNLTLRAIQKYAPKELTEEIINKIDTDLKAL